MLVWAGVERRREKAKDGSEVAGPDHVNLFRVIWEELEGFEQTIGFKWLSCYEKKALKQICIHCLNIKGILCILLYNLFFSKMNF